MCKILEWSRKSDKIGTFLEYLEETDVEGEKFISSFTFSFLDLVLYHIVN